MTVLADYQFEILPTPEAATGFVFGIGASVSLNDGGFDPGETTWTTQDQSNDRRGVVGFGRDVKGPRTWVWGTHTDQTRRHAQLVNRFDYGVQVLVETHSDHVLNGVRLAAADEHPLQVEDVFIHHFTPSPRGRGRATEIRLTTNGGLTQWPEEFFDQSEKDLARIMKARRRLDR